MSQYFSLFRVLRRSLSVVCFCLLLLLGASCAVNPVTGRSELAFMKMSPAEEAEIGMRAFPAAIQQMGGEVPDLQLQGYVQQVGERVAQAGHRPELEYQFRVVNQPLPNAFSLPGGYVAITRGLLVHLENESQLAAVLGHEIAHVTARHAAQGRQRDTLSQLAAAVLAGATGGESYGALAMQVGQVGSLLVENTFSREQERESDQLGIDYMVAAGYDPQGAIGLQEVFFRKLDQEQQPDWLNNVFRTHPFSRERLDNNRNYIRQRYAAVLGSSGARRGVEVFTKAIRYLKESEEGYRLYAQAIALEADGSPNEAIQTLLEALKVAPEEALLHTATGLAYLRQEDLISARRYLREAVALDSGHYQSHLGLGYVYLKRQEYPQAIRSLQRSVELLATAQGVYLLGEAYQGSGNREEAVRHYRAVVEAEPQSRLGQVARQKLQDLGVR